MMMQRSMKHLTLYAIALTVLASGSVFRAVAQTQTKPNKRAPGGQVTGRVTIGGRAAAGIVVSVRANNYNPWTDPSLKATTNQEGRYHISGISPGTYLIVPIAWAFVSETSSDGQRGRPVVIAEDENVGDIDFALVRGAVITGKVTDADGRPVMEESVNLMPVDQLNQRGTSYPGVIPFMTDDRGIYRMFGLPAGRFKVSVGQGDDDFSVGGGGRKSYRRTFSPDATDPAKAKVVEVTEGGEVRNVDIIVGQKVRGFSASGRVVDSESGRPLTNIELDLNRTVTIGSSTHSSGGSVGRSNHRGEFKIENLVPGKYSISISPPLDSDSDLRADTLLFDVVDQDLNGLLITASAGASLAGAVVFEGSNDARATAKLDQLFIAAHVQNGDLDRGSGRASQISANGSFRIGGLQTGVANLIVGSNKNKRPVILRIERNGAVEANGIQISNGEHLTGIKVIVAYGTGTIRGAIKLENGTLPAGARLYAQLSKPTDPSFSMGAEVDSRDHFVIERLMSGSYEIAVYGLVSPQRSRPVKQAVNVAEGAVTEVILTIDLKQKAAPTPIP